MKKNRFFEIVRRARDFFRSFQNMPIDSSEARENLLRMKHEEMLLLKPGDSGIYIYSTGMDGYPIGPYIFVNYNSETKQAKIAWADKNYGFIWDDFLQREIFKTDIIPEEKIHLVPIDEISHLDFGSTALVRIRKITGGGATWKKAKGE